MEFGTMAAWASVILGIVGMIGTIIWYLLKAKIEAAEKTADAAEAEAAAVSKDLATFKLSVAKEYASIGYLKDVEGRIVGAVEGVGRRFDEFLKEYHSRNRAGQ